MPYIKTRVSVSLTENQSETLKSELGKIIEIIPGKTESWLMVDLEDNCRLYFKGNQEAATAYVKVEVFGQVEREYCEKMTEAICNLLSQELQISPDRTYITYEGIKDWGWNGINF